MKIIRLIALISIVLGLTSCSGGDDHELIMYTVTFDADGGSPTPAVQRIESGGTVTAPSANPTKAGYAFVFWYLENTATAYSFQTPVTGNITLLAKWKEEATVEYWQVAWELNGGAWPAGDNHATQVVKGGTLTEPTAPVKNGYIFEGWYKEAALTNKIVFPYDVSNVTGNLILYAKWTKDDDPGGDTPPTTLYIAGKDDSGACCWRVDLATNTITKASLTAYGEANGIVISGSDMYISGFKRNTTSKSQACYWKNGEMYLLTEFAKNFEGYGIAVSGKDIYIVGEEMGSTGKPCYWKNRTHTILSTSAQSSGVSDIFVSGDDVYVTGWESPSVACYWKNGTKTVLTSNFSQSESSSIFVSGSDVYVAGRARYPGDWRACYWKNGSIVSLTDGTYGATVHAITVSGGKVYAAGNEGVGTGTVYAACYWVNGQKVTLEQSTLASVYDMKVSGNNVYAVGHVWFETDAALGKGNYKACYWKDGVRVDLTDGKKEAEALAVAFSWE